jgi:hypothetical protein
MRIKLWILTACLLLNGCDLESAVSSHAPHNEAVLEVPQQSVSPAPAPPSGQYAGTVVSFTPGLGSGYGANKMPSIVLGPPQGKGTLTGSMDVLSLGIGGEIVLDFSDHSILNKPGDDFIVFENAFWPADNPEAVFAELGEVSVSLDGHTWHTFPCHPDESDAAAWPGCAGWTPTLAFAPHMKPLDSDLTGGDAFDLEALGLNEARYIRIRDISGLGEPPSAGFDLDAIGIIHFHSKSTD